MNFELIEFECFKKVYNVLVESVYWWFSYLSIGFLGEKCEFEVYWINVNWKWIYI